ncbi:hypothetical protein D3C86_2158740 [compost metagenome]
MIKWTLGFKAANADNVLRFAMSIPIVIGSLNVPAFTPVSYAASISIRLTVLLIAGSNFVTGFFFVVFTS